MVMFVRVAILCLAMLAAHGVRAGTDDDQRQTATDRDILKHFEAVTIYRSGDTARALEMLGTMTADEQEEAVDAIHTREAYLASAKGRKPPLPGGIDWTGALLRALGALHMEAAAAVLTSDQGSAWGDARHHMRQGKKAFGAQVLHDRRNDHSAVRWILAIGLDRMAAARLGVAAAVLAAECAEHDGYAPLLVACGSLHESFAMLPAEDSRNMASFAMREALPFWLGAVAAETRRLMELRPRKEPPGFSDAYQRLTAGRAARNLHLSTARKYFERAIALDPRDTEAPLRLTHVRLQQGDLDEAAAMLDRLMPQPTLSAASLQLARLFLARIRTRQNRLDDAAAVLAKTVATQSGLIARAENALRRGRTSEAAQYAERAAQPALDDPWWGYAYGQYWLPPDLFKQLRTEARQ